MVKDPKPALTDITAALAAGAKVTAHGGGGGGGSGKQMLDTIETELVIEALTLAASRHDAYSRYRVESPSADQHQRKAKQMRTLRDRLCEEV